MAFNLGPGIGEVEVNHSAVNDVDNIHNTRKVLNSQTHMLGPTLNPRSLASSEQTVYSSATVDASGGSAKRGRPSFDRRSYMFPLVLNSPDLSLTSPYEPTYSVGVGTNDNAVIPPMLNCTHLDRYGRVPVCPFRGCLVNEIDVLARGVLTFEPAFDHL